MELDAVHLQFRDEIGVCRRADDRVLLDQFARRDPAHGDDPGDVERLGDVEKRLREAVVPDGLGRLMVADENQQVPVGLDRVDFDGCEFDDAVLVDTDLRGEVLGVNPPDHLAPELLDEVFGGEFADVADARYPLD